jgi:uncharacterized membrane-anchored protein YhcB (DUF1043 family)
MKITNEQRIKELDKLGLQWEKGKREVNKKYALSHQEYQKGDYIESKDGIIKIQEIAIGRLFYRLPECKYFGVKVRKSDLQSYKNKEQLAIYQSNVIKQHFKKTK